MQLTFQLHKFESRSAGVDKPASAIRPSEKAHRSSLRRCTTAKARAPRSPAPPAVNRTATCVTRHVSSALSAVVKTDRLFHCIWDKFVCTIVGALPHLRMSVNTFPLLTKNLRRNFAADTIFGVVAAKPTNPEDRLVQPKKQKKRGTPKNASSWFTIKRSAGRTVSVTETRRSFKFP